MVDPPRHNELRRVISPAFTPRRVALLEESIRHTARDLVAALPVDVIAQVAEVRPLVVIARLLGTVGEDIDEMARWSDEIAKLGLQLSPEERAASIAAFEGMNEFTSAQLAGKRASPRRTSSRLSSRRASAGSRSRRRTS
jgi:cytochrome P450